jgi:hypothetical protein
VCAALLFASKVTISIFSPSDLTAMFGEETTLADLITESKSSEMNKTVNC